MNEYVKMCPRCRKEKDKEYPLVVGYYDCYKIPADEKCYFCGTQLIDSNIPEEDMRVMRQVAWDANFIEAMIALHDSDIIEYNLKMSQFRSQVVQQECVKKAEDNRPKCPTCGSHNISKIGTGERVGSVAMWGIFSKKITEVLCPQWVHEVNMSYYWRCQL